MEAVVIYIVYSLIDIAKNRRKKSQIAVDIIFTAITLYECYLGVTSGLFTRLEIYLIWLLAIAVKQDWYTMQVTAWIMIGTTIYAIVIMIIEHKLWVFNIATCTVALVMILSVIAKQLGLADLLAFICITALFSRYNIYEQTLITLWIACTAMIAHIFYNKTKKRKAKAPYIPWMFISAMFVCIYCN